MGRHRQQGLQWKILKWSMCRELQYLPLMYAWVLSLLLFVTPGLSDTISNPDSITPFKCTTRLHYEIVARREIYLKGESTLLSYKFCANPVESIQWICRKATEVTLANPEGTTEVLLVLLAMYPCVHDVYKYWSHSLEASARNIRPVHIPEYISAVKWIP
jgi:hypothetical protein